MDYKTHQLDLNKCSEEFRLVHGELLKVFGHRRVFGFQMNSMYGDSMVITRPIMSIVCYNRNYKIIIKQRFPKYLILVGPSINLRNIFDSNLDPDFLSPFNTFKPLAGYNKFGELNLAFPFRSKGIHIDSVLKHDWASLFQFKKDYPHFDYEKALILEGMKDVFKETHKAIQRILAPSSIRGIVELGNILERTI